MERGLDAEQTHGAGDTAATGQQAEGGLGQADLDALDVRSDAVMGRESDLEAAAERGTVDGGDDGLAEGLEATQVCLDVLDLVERGLLVRPALDRDACSLRSPPAKKVFFADVITTPVMSPSRPRARSTVAAIDGLVERRSWCWRPGWGRPW